MNIISNFNTYVCTCILIFVVVQVSEESGSMDNSATDHAVEVDVDQLIGPHVINVIMNKPGMIR